MFIKIRDLHGVINVINVDMLEGYKFNAGRTTIKIGQDVVQVEGDITQDISKALSANGIKIFQI